MLITVKPGIDPGEVKRELVELGLWVQRLDDGERVHFLVEPHSTGVERGRLLAIRGVAAVAAGRSDHPLVDAQGPAVRVGPVVVGGDAPPVWIAGPCSVESEAQIQEAAAALAPLGVRLLRGGAFKPRSSPYSFQGHGEKALGWLRRAADEFHLGVVTEAMAPDEVGAVAEVADLVQIGSRNMQSFPLLKAAARAGRPVLLKRGMASTVEEWLLAAEYCLVHGAPGVVLCERGIRGFDPGTRNLLDLGAVALVAHHHRLPVVVDPSHATGRRDLVPHLALAALAAGACGLLIEVHLSPGDALSDGPQALRPAELAALVTSGGRHAHAHAHAHAHG